jgi:hypothetical protein
MEEADLPGSEVEISSDEAVEKLLAALEALTQPKA